MFSNNDSNNNYYDDALLVQKKLLLAYYSLAYRHYCIDQMNIFGIANDNSNQISPQNLKRYYMNLLWSNHSNEMIFKTMMDMTHSLLGMINTRIIESSGVLSKVNPMKEQKEEDENGEGRLIEMPQVTESTKSSDLIVESSTSSDSNNSQSEPKENKGFKGRSCLRNKRRRDNERQREIEDVYERNAKAKAKTKRNKMLRKKSVKRERSSALLIKDGLNNNITLNKGIKDEKDFKSFSISSKQIFAMSKYKKSLNAHDLMEKHFELNDIRNNDDVVHIDLDERKADIDSKAFGLLNYSKITNGKDNLSFGDDLPKKVWSFDEFNNSNHRKSELDEIIKEIESKWPRTSLQFKEDLILKILKQFNYDYSKALEFFNSKAFLNWIKDLNSSFFSNY